MVGSSIDIFYVDLNEMLGLTFFYPTVGDIE